MASKPIILPDSFSGESNWEQWLLHFNDCADVNQWDADNKLRFLKVRLTGRAQSVFHRLPDTDKASFQAAVVALEAHFEPKDSEKEQFYNLLLSFSEIFPDSNDDLGHTTVLKHQINTGSALPIRQPPRRVPKNKQEESHRLIQNMLDNNIISRSHSPWSSPIILVKKKDGSLRFCVDYRKVNEVTRKDAYPLPRIDDTLDTLAGSQWFTTLDLLSGYWQVEVEEEDREKTAFCTKEGLFHFNVMPFGLCNAPATFQRLMDMLLAGLLWEACLVYIDDVIIMGKDFPSHLSNIAAVFTRLRNAGLKVKPSKCEFFKRETPLKLIK
uniref:Reverse transcriptase domain-containing protein n=1 Tax=Amphimedon queenslandica TaxID=400682 RepID=A0A1X7TFY0_AMPQE